MLAENAIQSDANNMRMNAGLPKASGLAGPNVTHLSKDIRISYLITVQWTVYLGTYDFIKQITYLSHLNEDNRSSVKFKSHPTCSILQSLPHLTSKSSASVLFCNEKNKNALVFRIT